MKNILKSISKNQKGHILVEAMIALVVVGAVTFFIINNDIIPGLRTKWEAMNNTIQHDWTQ